MFFLNISVAEFLTLLGALGGLISALYLLDRAKRRKVVSTLQFWVQAGTAEERQARRRVNDPWSLILQLLSLLLLLLAIARMEWGRRESGARDHVLLLDTGSWSAAKAAGDRAGRSVLEREKQQARRYLDTLPTTDRVMLVGVGALATPLTRFTADRHQLAAALEGTSAGFSALNMNAALAFARQARQWSGGDAGEIVYTGPLLADEDTSGDGLDRVLPVAADRENSGIRQFAVEQEEDEANTWQAFVRVKNYGDQLRTLRLAMHYAGTTFSPRVLTIAGGGEATAEYVFTTRTAGSLTAVLAGNDSLASDDRASLFLPRTDLVRVAVYTRRPDILKPLLAANRQLQPTFYTPEQYVRQPAADVVVIDSVAVSPEPTVPTLWINPAKDHSPLPVKNAVQNPLLSWNADGPLAVALHAKPLALSAANTFETFENDDVVGSVPEGPVVVLRAGNGRHVRSALVGFDPAAGPLRFEVATPLLFASLLEELTPGAFRARTYTAEQVGLARVSLDRVEQRSGVRVTDDSGRLLPSTQHGGELQLFVEHPATLHVSSGERERVIDMRLPGLAERNWHTPARASVGLPAVSRIEPRAIDLWKWLALAAACCLMAEWFLFGPRRRAGKTVPRAPRQQRESRDREREFAAK